MNPNHSDGNPWGNGQGQRVGITHYRSIDYIMGTLAREQK